MKLHRSAAKRSDNDEYGSGIRILVCETAKIAVSAVERHIVASLSAWARAFDGDSSNIIRETLVFLY